jgi:hypothetical protein
MILIIYEREVYDSIWETADPTGIQLVPQMDPAFQMVGYDHLGREISDKLAKMPQPERTFIFTKRYQEAAALAFYVEGNPRTYNINFGERRMNQYFLWPGIDESMTGWDAIYVIEGRGTRLKDEVANAFEAVNPAKVVDIEVNDIEYRRFTYWRCYGFKGAFEGAVEQVDKY